MGVSGPRTHSATELCLFAAPSSYRALCLEQLQRFRETNMLVFGTQKPRRLKEVAWVHGCAGRKLAASPKGHPGVPSVASCKASCVLMKHLARVTGSFPPSD